MDVDLPPVNNMQLVPKQQKEPDSIIEICHEPKVSGGYGYEDIMSYVLTSFGYPSSFRETIVI